MVDKSSSVKKPWGAPVIKQQSMPNRPTPGICSQERKISHPAEIINKYAKPPNSGTKSKCAKSPTSIDIKRAHSKITESVVTLLPKVPPSRVPSDVDYRELAIPLKKRLWKNMSEDQRQLKTKKFLSVFFRDIKIMDDVLTNYRDGEGLRKKLAMYSMFGDCLSSSKTATDETKNIKSLVKETFDKEIQTGEDQTEGSLRSDLDSANASLKCLKRELREKTKRLKNESEKNEKLNLKITELLDAEKEKEKIEKEIIIELSTTKEEKDNIDKELIKLKDEHATLKSKFLMQKSEIDRMRVMKVVYPEQLISDRDDEIESRDVIIENLENRIAEYQEDVENLKEDNESKKAEINELKEIVESWEKQSNNVLTNYVTNVYTPVVKTLKNENDSLKTDIDQLRDGHQQYISEKKEQINRLQKILKSKEELIEEQNKVIEYTKDMMNKKPPVVNDQWSFKNMFRW